MDTGGKARTSSASARRRLFAPRSTVEWAVRLAIVAAAGWLGYASVARSLASVLQNADVSRAYAIVPRDAQVAGRFAQLTAGVSASAVDRIRADVIARNALRRDPTTVAAVATLGLDAQVRGDTAQARRAFAYAESLSRRDLQTQLWAVEDAVARSNIDDALHHYDIALRTTRNAPELLYPIMTAAIGEPAVRSALVRTLAARPPWGGFFIDYASSHGSDPRADLDFFMQLRRSGVPISQSAHATLISAVVGRGLYRPAWSYYASTLGRANPRFSRDPGLSRDLVTPTLFDWIAISNANLTATLRAEGGFDFTAFAGAGGRVLQQMQILSPGTYRLTGRSADIDLPASARPYWTLTCLDGRELGRVPVPTPGNGTGAFAGGFDVPVLCPVQTLALVVRPSDAMAETSGRIVSARLTPSDPS